MLMNYNKNERLESKNNNSSLNLNHRPSSMHKNFEEKNKFLLGAFREMLKDASSNM